MKNTEKPLILSLETCTRNGGIALLRGEEVLAEKAGLEKSPHSVRLLPDVRQLLDETNLDLKDLDLVAAAVGPGSFTGLRIGLATAKALVAALKIPAIGVSTLAAAASASENNGEIFVLISAGRNELFAQLFSKSAADGLQPKSEIKICKIENLFQEIAFETNFTLVSDREIFVEISKPENQRKFNFQAFPENLSIEIGKVAERILKQNREQQNYLNPIYVRGADIGKSKDGD